MEELVFYIFATISVAAALMVVTQKRAVYSALSLIVCFGAIAVLFYQLGAYFIAAIQVIVYAGAIMVLFLFVVMLIDPESEVLALNRIRRVSVMALPAAAIFGLVLLSAVMAVRVPRGSWAPDLSEVGGIRPIATSLFSDYLLPFEVTSILILVAVIGAMVLAKKN